MSRLAGIAAGADGLIIEIHPNPDKALCDGYQSLHLDEFDKLMKQVTTIANAVGKTV